MAHRILRDHDADGWERSDFPVVCESCLGDNPYVQMTKAEYDKECKICTRPFTVFRWRPGRDARYKKTEICQTCCKLKNVCQVCLLDLEYGLPVQARDTALNISTHDSIPKSDVNREYFAEEHDRKTRAGLDYESSFGKMRPHDTILKLQRTTPLGHVCSFFIRGECTRGEECPYRHEMPETGELSQQNIKDRYYGVNDPVALKLLGKAGEMGTLESPDDESIKTLYVGGLNSRILEQDLLDQFYAYGEIESIRVLADKACAFVTYTAREGAEKAAQELANRLVVNGQRLKLMWGRPQAPRPDQDGSNQQGGVAHSSLLPRTIISQQDNQPPPMQQYYMHPPPPNQDKPYYPSMDAQRMGAVISTQEAGGSSTTENKGASSYAYMMPPHQPYPPAPYGYMPSPYQQQYYHPGPMHHHHAPPPGAYQPYPQQPGSESRPAPSQSLSVSLREEKLHKGSLQQTHHQMAKNKEKVDSGLEIDDADLILKVTTSNIEKDTIGIDKANRKKHNWTKKTPKLQIQLMNKEGNSWHTTLIFSKARGRHTISGGWTTFCNDNKLEDGDTSMFRKIEEVGHTLTFQLVSVVKANGQEQEEQPDNLPEPEVVHIGKQKCSQMQSQIRELRSGSSYIKEEIMKLQENYREQFNQLGEGITKLSNAAENYHTLLLENRKLFNENQELKGNIRVFCRVRPFLPGEVARNTVVHYIGEDGELVVSNPENPGRNGLETFRFNKVYSSAATQAEIFKDLKPLVRSVLDGFKVCIFAYGQTGSGKTYTMTGPDGASEEDQGVNYRALNDIFKISQSRKGVINYQVGVQILEIYNENVLDLLSSRNKVVILSAASENGLAVPDAKMCPVTSTSDVIKLMATALKNRSVGATAMNEASSRSHSIVIVHVTGKDIKTGEMLYGNLHLVDLAGNERAYVSKVQGDRLEETKHINKSLTHLGDVISALGSNKSHIPYRNSKLTHLLQNSLGGHAKTLMFVQISPDTCSYCDSITTLKFAQRVSGVELGAAKSSKDGGDLMKQIASLRDTIARKDEEIERLHSVKDIHRASSSFDPSDLSPMMSSLSFRQLNPRAPEFLPRTLTTPQRYPRPPTFNIPSLGTMHHPRSAKHPVGTATKRPPSSAMKPTTGQRKDA